MTRAAPMVERASRMRRRRLHRNPVLVHMAVRFMRRKQHRVMVAKRAAGGVETHHDLDGVICPTIWLMDMAIAEGFRPEFATSADPNLRPRR